MTNEQAAEQHLFLNGIWAKETSQFKHGVRNFIAGINHSNKWFPASELPSTVCPVVGLEIDDQGNYIPYMVFYTNGYNLSEIREGWFEKVGNPFVDDVCYEKRNIVLWRHIELPQKHEN